ncbi:MAG TPA: choice-of-anchor tandem repeat GloVer-containing protein [Gaiellaceae bacterium]|nr:choice-of-anchor tandem repeat GloVer-containing protein [Gaiellaceae bacterium]
MRIKALGLVVPVATLVLAVPAIASAASLTLLHSFGGPEGATPAAPLVQGADGFVYGVAAHGGDLAVLPPDGGGTAFRLDASGTVTTLHTFRGLEGAVPRSLIQGRDGSYYGTTTYGGRAPISSLEPGFGTIFRMDAAGAVTVLHVFPGGSGGAFPGPIIQGADGALYGNAVGGVQIQPAIYAGFVYRFDPVSGDFRHLHDFVVSDGRTPTGPLFQGSDRSFYGTTSQGGPWNAGVVYKVDVLGNFVLLHGLSPLFPGDGSEPKGGVVQASDGFFYGTTELGGYGGGIFRLDAAGNFAVVHRFDAYASDGRSPVSGLTEGRDGFLYGTAPLGGQPVTAPSRRGVVYRMDTAGAVTVVHTFTGPDGAAPQAALVQGADGGLYGSTVVGGAFGLGVLFRLDPAAPSPPPTVTGLTLTPTSVAGGQSSTGRVTLSGPAPSGSAVVTLSSSNSSLVSVPQALVVPAGATSASFTASTKPVKRTRTATIEARYNGTSASATLTITR